MIDSLAQAATGYGILAAAFFAGWQSWKSRKQATAANANAAQAAENARPVSNGFSAKVLTDLDYLRKGMDRLGTELTATTERQTAADDRMNSLTDLMARHVTDERKHAA